jgi:alpha-beta hydrolase superfamily lysophospholipase
MMELARDRIRMVGSCAVLTVAGPLAAQVPTDSTLRSHPELEPVTVIAESKDGHDVFGYRYGVADRVPGAVVVAFHQARANARGEYGPIAPRLVQEGFEVLAFDLRSGGDLFGARNRTVEGWAEAQGYCDAIADVLGALAYARRYAERLDVGAPPPPLVPVGSSYSAALVLRAVALDPSAVGGVVSFSPASGGPMAACRGEEVSGKLLVPVLVFRPLSEMQVESVAAQTALFREQGHEVFVADPGTHGASMLVADRVEGDVEPSWARLLDFLGSVSE